MNSHCHFADNLEDPIPDRNGFIVFTGSDCRPSKKWGAAAVDGAGLAAYMPRP